MSAHTIAGDTPAIGAAAEGPTGSGADLGPSPLAAENLDLAYD